MPRAAKRRRSRTPSPTRRKSYGSPKGTAGGCSKRRMNECFGKCKWIVIDGRGRCVGIGYLTPTHKRTSRTRRRLS